MTASLPGVQPIGELAQWEPKVASGAAREMPPLPLPLWTVPVSSQTPAVSSAQTSREPAEALDNVKV